MFQPRMSAPHITIWPQLRLPSISPTITGGRDLSVRFASFSLRSTISEPPRDTPPKNSNFVGLYSTASLASVTESVCELLPPTQVRPFGLTCLAK